MWHVVTETRGVHTDGVTPDEDGLYPKRWWTLAVLCLSLLIIFVGNSSLNVAIPTLSQELHASTSQLQWVIASYSLVFAGLLFAGGALGDRFGRKGALQLGLLGFLIAAALAANSHAMWQFIGCRALMGASAAFVMPSTLSILVNVFPPHERARAIALWAGITGGAGPLGQLISGWLLNHFWVGSIFLVNLPIVALALILGIFFVPTSKDPEEGRLDVGGSILSVVGIGSLVYGLIQAPEHGWTGTVTLTGFGIGIVGLLLFVLWERRTDEPMLDMAYFRNPAFSTGTGGMMLVFLGMYGTMFLMTQFFQLVLGYSPLAAAVRLVPMAPIMMIVAPMTPRLSDRYGANRAVAAGMALIAIAFLGMSFTTVNTDYPQILVFVGILTAGIALTMSPMTGAIMSAVPPRRAGAGSAMNDATREMGAALGVAVIGSIAASRYSRGISGAIASLSPADQSAARTSLGAALQTARHLPAEAAARLTSAADHAFVSGVHWATLTGTVLATVATFAVWRWLPHELPHEGANAGAVEAAEDAAQLGLAGVPPIFADTVDA
jgi:EmrB/QacA subfamily drug resistance transporter